MHTCAIFLMFLIVRSNQQAYDYSVAAEYHAAVKQQDAKKEREQMEQNCGSELSMDSDPNRKETAICAGKKRSIKERIGTRKSDHPRKNKDNGHRYGEDGYSQREGETMDDMSIPQPGVPRTIPDLPPEIIDSILSKDIPDPDDGQPSPTVDDMEEQSGKTQSKSAELLGEELAARLCEPKTE